MLIVALLSLSTETGTQTQKSADFRHALRVPPQDIIHHGKVRASYGTNPKWIINSFLESGGFAALS